MKKLISMLAVLIVLLTVAGVVSAGHSLLGPFSITGEQKTSETEYLADFQFLKFHITSAGDVDTQGHSDGKFVMEEWGVADLSTFAGANFGNIKTKTRDDGLLLRFSGNANLATGVTGSFLAFDKTDGYRERVGVGTYVGDVNDPFTVAFTPCGGWGGPACNVNRCAVFGGALEARYSRAVWQIRNEGAKPLTIDNLFVNWPVGNGKLLKIKLDGNTIFDQETIAPWVQIGAAGPGWVGAERDRKIGVGRTAELKFIFETPGGNPAPKDYAVLVNFAGGCAVSWAAF